VSNHKVVTVSDGGLLQRDLVLHALRQVVPQSVLIAPSQAADAQLAVME
jgi:hypothetical protein